MCANCALYIINMQCILLPSFQGPKASWEIRRKKSGDSTCPQHSPPPFADFRLMLFIRTGGKHSFIWQSVTILVTQLCLLKQCTHVHCSAISLEFQHTGSSCLRFADTDAFYSAVSRKTMSKKILLSTWQNQFSLNFKTLGHLDVITCINRMTHTILLLFVTYISLFSFSCQRADNCSLPWR